MKCIDVFISEFTEPFPESVWNSYYQLLPLELKKKNDCQRRWQEKHSNLIGKLLLNEALLKYGYKEALLNLKYNRYGRPYIDEIIDFNISHSGKYVICTIGRNIKLGVDIEKVEFINFNDYINTMNEREWGYINNSNNSYFSFFQYWSIKESVIKAVGKGLSIPLKSIYIKNTEAYYGEKRWFIKELCIDKNYSCYLAIDNPHVTIKVNKLIF